MWDKTNGGGDRSLRSGRRNPAHGRNPASKELERKKEKLRILR